ncbi:MAG: hypothetical protein GX213_14310 [Clostridiaceae bacterium]|nr:hypothetical protein [Clostridiaceae bacterium]
MLIKQKDLLLEISPPEENGMNPLLLRIMNEKMKEQAIRNVVILKNKKLVWEYHEDGFDKVNYIFSCTKSIIATLIGIAIDKGYIESVEQPISYYFKTLKLSGV